MRASIVAAALSLALYSVPADAQSRYDRERAPAPTAGQFTDQFDARIAKLKADLRLTSDQARNWDSLRNALHDIGAARADRLVRIYADQGRDVGDGNTSVEQGAPVPQSARPNDGGPPADRDTTAADGVNPSTDDRLAADDRARDRSALQERDRRDDTRDRDPRDVRSRDDDALSTMRLEAEAMRAEADELMKIADAADPLYVTLDNRQRRLLLRFIARDWQSQPTPRRG
jgi:hypothetical protein